MTEQQLDALLNQTLPERDGGEFSVMLMERITQAEARPARFFAWMTSAILSVVVAGACVFGASLGASAVFGTQNLTIPGVLTLLMLLLSFVVVQSARE